jgi:hypothetical protein
MCMLEEMGLVLGIKNIWKSYFAQSTLVNTVVQTASMRFYAYKKKVSHFNPNAVITQY